MSEIPKKYKGRRGAKAKPKPGQKTLNDMFGNKLSSSTKAQHDIETGLVDVDFEDQKSGATAVVDAPAPQSIRIDSPNQSKRVYAIFEKRGRPPTIPSQPSSLSSISRNEVIEILDEDSTLEGEKGSVLTLHLPTQNTPPPDMKVSIADGGSRDDPIIVGSSPVKSPAPKTTSRISDKPLWSIFDRPIARSSVTPSREIRKSSTALKPAVPDELSQHVRGPQTQYDRGALPFTRRENVIQESTFGGSFSLKALLSHNDTPAMPPHTTTPAADTDENYIVNIPRTHRSYPAVSRLLNHSNNIVSGGSATNIRNTSSQEWTQKWRPRRADEVLGNEERALYLRDWLVALRLHISNVSKAGGDQETRKKRKAKKLKIVRHVSKRRKLDCSDNEDDFVVPDDTSEFMDHEVTSEEDEFDFCRRVQDRLLSSDPSSPIPSSYPSPSPADEATEDELPPISYRPAQFGSEVCNTILLTGPCGSGKTASVYACAEELGWDVFEVYPGIGERSGAELQKLIGDVGKNHLVNASHLQRPPSPPPVHNFFGGRKKPLGKTRKPILRMDSDEEVIDNLPVVSTELHNEGSSHVAEPSVKQSLVLLEEVDVLYQTDANFWPALINIIKDCRRPVILTCNDLSVIPWHDLPLQTVLQFERCPAPLATSYLQAVCHAEGFPMDRGFIGRLYCGEDETSSELEDRNSTLLSHSACQHDLRHAINQLQCYAPKVSTATISPHENQGNSSGEVDKPPVTFLTTEAVTSSACGTEGHPNLSWLKLIDKAYESISFSDPYLLRGNAGLSDMSLMEEDIPFGDNLLGYPVLRMDDFSSRIVPISSFYQQDRAMEKEVRSLSHAILRCPQLTVLHLPKDVLCRTVTEARLTYGVRIESIFARCQLDCKFLGEAQLYLDYVPWIRFMVGVDNATNDAISPAGSQVVGRPTRNSQKSVYRRYLELEGVELEALASTAFRIDDC